MTCFSYMTVNILHRGDKNNNNNNNNNPITNQALKSETMKKEHAC